MKPIAGGILFCLGLLTASSQAQSIYKCVVQGAITYQQTPCEVPAPAKGVSSNTALIGQWRYDRDATMAWTKRHSTLTKDQEAELDGLAGHLTYTFTSDRASWEVTDYDIAVANRVLHRKGLREAVPYTVISANPQTVTVSSQNPDTLSVYATDFHFEGRNTMWVSMANQKLTSVENANARAYYVRVR